MAQYSLEISYLIASIAFIIGLKFLGHPETARKGNIIAAIGMFLAVITTIFLYKSPEGKSLGNYVWIFGGIIIGTVVGTLMAKKVQMTAMPQMVSLFNGVGAACVALISVVEFSHYNTTHTGASLFNGLTPVSYTHLDVYKRQAKHN